MMSLHFGSFCSILFLLILCFLTILAELVLNGRGRTMDSTGENKNCRCSEEETFADMLRSGAFKSPGFPTNYCDLLDCKWNIQPAENSFVSAALDFFETEHKYDALEVYQTHWNGSQLLMAKQTRLSGNFDPRTMPRHFFSSLSGGLLFRFRTDNTNHNYQGFQITFQRHNKDQFNKFKQQYSYFLLINNFRPIILNDRLNSPCPMPFHLAADQSQNLPVLDAQFRTDSACVFVINSTKAIKLNVKRFAASSLTIEIYETENFAAAIENSNVIALARLNKFSPHQVITSRTSSLTFLLLTFSNFFLGLGQSLNSADLYEIEFERTKSVCECFPTELAISRIKSTQLLSPGFPLEYCDNHNCSTHISLERPLVPKSIGRDLVEVLRIRFESFKLEQYTDYISLNAMPPNANVNQQGSTSLITLSDDAQTIRQFTFDFPQFGLDFITDHSVVDSGFNLTIESYQKPKDCICPGAPLNILEGNKHTEWNQFDPVKCKSMDCFWEIRPPKPSIYRLLFKINHTVVDHSEQLLIYQFTSTDRRRVFSFRGDASNSGEEHSIQFDNGSPLYLSSLDRDGPMQPFIIWYHREWLDTLDTIYPDLKREFKFSYEWREVCQCGDPILEASTDKWQPLRSPDNPYSYCSLMRCQWLLNAPEGHHLLLNITQFATEADQDFLTIFDGNDTTKKHMEMLSGLINFKSALRNEKNQMTLLFISDSSIQMDGFEIWFKAVPNPELLAALKEGKSRYPKLLIFWIFLLTTISGIIFLTARSRGNGIVVDGIRTMWPPTWIWSWTNNFGSSEWGQSRLPEFVEGRVRFIRNWAQQNRHLGQRQPLNHDDATEDLNADQRSNFSANNPFFNPFH